MSQTIHTNDTGIDLDDAKLPQHAMLGDDVSDDGKQPVDPQEQTAPADPELQVRQAIIAGEDRLQRRQMIMRLQRYYKSERFIQCLREYDLIEDLKEKTLPEMAQLLKEIQFTIQNKNSGNMIQQMAPQFIASCEPVISIVYDVKGLGSALSKDETFKDIVEEMALESQVFSNTPASTRLCWTIVKTAFFVHQANAFKRGVVASVVEKRVQPSDAVADLMR